MSIFLKCIVKVPLVIGLFVVGEKNNWPFIDIGMLEIYSFMIGINESGM